MMFNALLLAVVQLIQSAVNYSLGTILIVAAVVAVVNAGRWVATDACADHLSGGSLSLGRKGTQSLTLAVVMVGALGCLAAGILLWIH